MLTNIEEFSLNAWPAHQTVLYNGWVLRFANGYTRRANSINPIYAPGVELEINEKINFCEQTYQSKNLPVIFKITPTVFPGNLDAVLQACGYQKEAPTSVQSLELDGVSPQRNQGVNLQEELSVDWLEAFCNASAVSPVNRESLQKILSGIVSDHCFASIESNDRLVACGMGVQQAGFVGLFDIVTDKDHRGQGYARQIVHQILAWGYARGAKVACLQVMLNNAPALHLYSKIGFAENYQYWYRVKP